jgi:hypothetical protein
VLAGPVLAGPVLAGPVLAGPGLAGPGLAGPGLAGKALDRRHLVAAGLGRQDRAGLHRDAVERHRAGAALRGVAADVGAGEAQLITEEVDEESAGRDSSGALGAVDCQLDGDLALGGHLITLLP